MAKGWKDLDLDDLADLGSTGQNSVDENKNTALMGFQRLQTKAAMEAAAAQIGAAGDATAAAKAAKETAEYTKDSAFWMKMSVIVLAISSVLTLIVTVALAVTHKGP